MNATPNNLPLQLSRFIGRKREIDGVRQLLVPTPAGMGTRLVTLTGAGGSGKTRLALEIASAICKDIPPETLYPDGVWFIDLAPLSDPDLVSQTLATTLDLSEHPGRVIAVALTD